MQVVPLIVAVIEQVREAIPASRGSCWRCIQLEEDVPLVHIKVILLLERLVIVLGTPLLPAELLKQVIKRETAYQLDGDLFVLREKVNANEEAST